MAGTIHFDVTDEATNIDIRLNDVDFNGKINLLNSLLDGLNMDEADALVALMCIKAKNSEKGDE